MPETTAPVTAEDYREGLRETARAAFASRKLPDGSYAIYSDRNPWRALDDAVDAVLAALAGDPGDLPVRDEELERLREIEKVTTVPADAEDLRERYALAAAKWALMYPISSWALADGEKAVRLAKVWGEQIARFLDEAVRDEELERLRGVVEERSTALGLEIQRRVASEGEHLVTQERLKQKRAELERLRAELAEDPQPDVSDEQVSPFSSREERLAIALKRMGELVDRRGKELKEAEAERDALKAELARHVAAVWTVPGEEPETVIAERDAFKAAIVDVRRLQELTIAASCRVQAINQAVDTLAVLDRALPATPAPTPAPAGTEVHGEAGEAQESVRMLHESHCDARYSGCCSCSGEAQEGSR